MASFTAGTTFVDGVANDVTAAKLGALVNNATPTSGLIQDRTAETVVATNDTFLIGDASDSNTLKRMTVANVMKAELTGTINTTAGTIATLNSTTGTITTGVIPTLTSITKITSGTGTAAAPAISPTGDTNTGVFFPAADTIAFSEGGAEVMRITAGGSVGIGTTSPTEKLDVNGTINATSLTIGTGTAAVPAIYPATDTNTGIFFPTADTIAFAEGGAEIMRIDSIGQVGINTNNASAKLDAQTTGNGWIGRFLNSTASGTPQGVQIVVGQDSTNVVLDVAQGTDYTTTTSLLKVQGNGNVGIGIASPATKLEVNGSVRIGSGNDFQFNPTLFMNGESTGTTGYLRFFTNTTERLRIDSSGNVGIGTASPTSKLDVDGSFNATSGTIPTLVATTLITTGTGTAAAPAIVPTGDTNTGIFFPAADTIAFAEGGAEAMRISSSGVVLIGKTSTLSSVAGVLLDKTANEFTVSGSQVMSLNRLASDGALIAFYQDNTIEGTISVSGTTVSYNGGHLSRWSQLLNGQRDASIKKGTVMSNLNEMCEWFDKDGNLLPNEQLNKVKVSDIEGESNVAGVFVNWDDDDKDNPFDMNMAMTGDMIIRIAQGTIVNRGDLLMSAGNGTAKPQGDDTIRSKTIAKVTSTNVTCTYEDGSYCVPCVLMAC